MPGTLSILAEFTSANVQKDISALLVHKWIKSPLWSWIGFAPPMRGEADGKFSWPELAFEETTGTLAANYSLAGTITVSAGHGARFKVGDQIAIDGHVDATFVQLVFRIVSIATDVLTVSLIKGTDTALTSTGQTVYRWFGSVDGSGAEDKKIDQHTLSTNYFQTFTENFTLGRKAMELAQSGGVPGVQNLFTEALNQAMSNLLYQIGRAIWTGVGAAETTSLGSRMSGIDTLVNTGTLSTGVGRRRNAGATTIDETELNDVALALLNNGLTANEGLRIVCNAAQARVIGSLRENKIQLVQSERQIGQQVDTYLPNVLGLNSIPITVDLNRPSNVIYMLSPSHVKIVPKLHPATPTDMQSASLTVPGTDIQIPSNLVWLSDSTTPGTDGVRFTLRTELSIMVRYATRLHGCVVNLV